MARVSVCYGRYYGTSWPIGKSFPSDASWIRLLCARDHGVQGAGTQEGPSEDDSCDAVYVLQCETSDLRAVLLHVFRKIRDGGVLFHVSSRNRGCDLTAYILSKVDGSKAENELLIELPEYKAPNARTIALYVWEKVKDYLTKAGTVIFLASIIMWILLNFGTTGYVTDISESFGSLIGKAIVPFFAPLGLGYWQIVVALISGIAAKEVVVSSCSVLFGIQNITTAHGMDSFVALLASMGFGAANAYSLMVFCLLYVPCTATIATINREVGSKKLTLGIILFQLATAWVVSFLIYHIAGLFM